MRRPRRLVLNLSDQGELFFRRYCLRLHREGGGFRAEAEQHLREGLSSVSPGAVVLVNAPRGVPWRDVSWLLHRVSEHPSPTFDLLQWTVFPLVPEQDRIHEARVSALKESDLPARAMRIALAVRGDPSGSDLIDLAITEQAWSFMWTEGSLADDGFVQAANAVWESVDAHIAEAVPPGATVYLDTHSGAERVPWAFYVKVFDLLMGAGVRDVGLPDLGVRLDLLPPEAEPEYRDDDCVPTLGQAVLILAALALAFLITLGPLRGARARRQGQAERRNPGFGIPCWLFSGDFARNIDFTMPFRRDGRPRALLHDGRETAHCHREAKG